MGDTQRKPDTLDMVKKRDTFCFESWTNFVLTSAVSAEIITKKEDQLQGNGLPRGIDHN